MSPETKRKELPDTSKKKESESMDRLPAWARSIVRFIREPLRPSDIFIGFFVAITLFLLFQAPYFFAHIKYWTSQISYEAVLIEGDLRLELQPNMIFLPRIGVTAPLIYIESDSEAAIQKALEHGVVHYAGTALPGEYGNAYFTGHSSDLPWKNGEYKTIFALLPYVRVDDEIYVTTDTGERLIYTVHETRIVSAKDLSVLGQFNDERRLLTLQTSYPIGTALKRYIVIAELKSE